MGEMILTGGFTIVAVLLFVALYVVPAALVVVGVVLAIKLTPKRYIGILVAVVGLLYALFVVLWKTGVLHL